MLSEETKEMMQELGEFEMTNDMSTALHRALHYVLFCNLHFPDSKNLKAGYELLQEIKSRDTTRAKALDDAAALAIEKMYVVPDTVVQHNHNRLCDEIATKIRALSQIAI